MPAEAQRFDVAVLGAGGAGLLCAREAGLRGRKVVVLDHAERIGRKILVSGGGRCNFTNLGAAPDRYVSRNPRFCVSALSRYTPQDFIALVEDHGIAYHEKKLGQLFCDRSASQIVDLLVAECARAGATLVQGCRVNSVRRTAGGFRLETSAGVFASDALVVATGGLSITKTGATGLGHLLARQFGLAVVEPEPALVGLRWAPPDLVQWADLAGVAVPDCEVRCGSAAFREAVLLTHTGLSGPAILQASLYWHPGEPLVIDLVPDLDVRAWLAAARAARGTAPVPELLADKLPRRFAARFGILKMPAEPVARLSDAALDGIAERLHRWTVVPAATEGWEKAEVTRGGVDTAELSSKTMEAVKVPGLYFIGEVVDVTGWLGGYNFQWAWASGAAAGRAA